eukprot:11170229-Lingulodinium_polyedra.AAC.1
MALRAARRSGQWPAPRGRAAAMERRPKAATDRHEPPERRGLPITGGRCRRRVRRLGRRGG